jgi:hypothetical protein
VISPPDTDVEEGMFGVGSATRADCEKREEARRFEEMPDGRITGPGALPLAIREVSNRPKRLLRLRGLTLEDE